MALRSLGQLDLTASWARVLNAARQRNLDVPDRLQLEVDARRWRDQPKLTEPDLLNPVDLVMATKPGYMTARPFVRVQTVDLLLYQALVDQLRDAIEASLPRCHIVFSNRLAPLGNADAFQGSPSYGDFKMAIRDAIRDEEATSDRYWVRGDINSFYLNVQLPILERRLLSIGGTPDVVFDLIDLLRRWQVQGIQGLPQGLEPSGPLANVYLSFLDETLRAYGGRFWRYSDDFVADVSTFGGAREVLDTLERGLYDVGLSLNPSKTGIHRGHRLDGALVSPEERTETLLEELALAPDYRPTDEELSAAEVGIVRAAWDKAVRALAVDEYNRNELSYCLRTLGAIGDPYALTYVAYVLTRLPGLTPVGTQYVAQIARKSDDRAGNVVDQLFGHAFHRDQEWMFLCNAALSLTSCAERTVHRLGVLALNHPCPPVRARAILAWGKHSDPQATSVATDYFRGESSAWRSYAIVSIQSKDLRVREPILQLWEREGRELSDVISMVRHEPFEWRAV